MYLLLSLFVALAFARAPLIGGDHAEKIDGSYVVLFNPTTSADVQAKHREMWGKSVTFKYNITQNFMGYAAALDAAQLEIVLNDPNVKEVHYNHAVHVFDHQQDECDSQQKNVRAWGICRVSQWGKIGTDSLTTYKWEAGKAGNGVDVYVIDTGIRCEHVDFEGRCVWGETFTPDGVRTDDNGHGTHCAGTIGGITVGLARDCRLIAVKVLNRQGSGTLAGVAAGCDYVANMYKERQIPSVASMSLGGGYSEILNEAVRNLVLAGVFTAVAAGNDNADACNYSPASVEEACTVAATTTDASNNDVRSSFSNWGDCVDFFAPGSNIYSCGITSNSAYTTLSGTSMACPHVAGLAAVILQAQPHLTPLRIKEAIIADSNWDMVLDHYSKNNALAYNGC